MKQLEIDTRVVIESTARTVRIGTAGWHDRIVAMRIDVPARDEDDDALLATSWSWTRTMGELGWFSPANYGRNRTGVPSKLRPGQAVTSGARLVNRPRRERVTSPTQYA